MILIIAILLAFDGGCLRAADVELDALLKNSPFGAPVSSIAIPEAAKALEFRGVFMDKGELFFSFYEESSRSSRWVGLNEAGNSFLVRSYDAAKGEVHVDYQGRVLTIGLKQARVVALAPAPVPAAPPQAGTLAGALSNPVMVPGGTPDEAARLAQIAEEIRRRRALRQQTLQPSRPTPAPPTK